MSKDKELPKGKLEGYKCLRCNHVWIPQKKNKVPVECPLCKSEYWYTKRYVAPGPKRESGGQRKRQ